MDVTDSALESCSTYHMDHLCENLHVTTDVKELNCAIAIYIYSVETSSHSAKHIQNIIKTKCRFIYHEVLHPTLTTLQTQDEILFANFPSENWQLICDEITDRTSFIKGDLYTIINLQDLCTCGILTQEGRFMYESMRSCDSPDTEVDLHFTYNRALVNYDNHITAQDSKRYAIKPYTFQASDLQYYEHMPYVTVLRAPLIFMHQLTQCAGSQGPLGLGYSHPKLWYGRYELVKQLLEANRQQLLPGT